MAGSSCMVQAPGACQCGSTPCTGSCCYTCLTCNIPKSDVSFSMADYSYHAGGVSLKWFGVSGTLSWDSVNSWWRGTFGTYQTGTGFFITCGMRITVTCTSGSAALSIDTTNCLDSGTGVITGTPSSYTCGPLNIGFVLQIGGYSYPSTPLAYFTGPAFSGAMCCQTFNVKGCSSTALQGATINIYDHAGGTLLTSGTTNSSGLSTLLWNRACASSVYVTISCSRFTTYTATLTLTANGTTNVTLSPAAGYDCTGCTAIPLADTIYLTDSVYGGPVTLTYSAGNWVSGTTSWSFPGDACCGAASFGMVYTLTGSTCVLSATYGHAPPVVGNPICPTGTGRQTLVAAGGTAIVAPLYCGDATAWHFSVTPTTTACVANAEYLYPSGGTWTATE